MQESPGTTRAGRPGRRRRRRGVLLGSAAICLAVAAVGTGSAAQATTASPKYAHAWLNPKLGPGQRASALLAQMTLAQKLQMVDGTGFAFGSGVNYAGHIQGIPALGIPDLYLADGAVGAGNGSTGVTQFPDGTSDAATWDPGTVQSVGAADGTEQAAKATRSRWRRTSTSSARRTAAALSRGTARTRTSRRRSPPRTSPACRAPA